jgi:hypothetical protein
MTLLSYLNMKAYAASRTTDKLAIELLPYVPGVQCSEHGLASSVMVC